jgi:cytochrome c
LPVTPEGKWMRKRTIAATLSTYLVAMAMPSIATAAPLPKPPAFGICGVCHKVDKGAPNGVGPNLFGIGGTKSGAVPGFTFSPAMAKGGIVWNRANLVKFVMEPQKTVPGTRMPFAGLKNQQQAEAIADYILSLK